MKNCEFSDKYSKSALSMEKAAMLAARLNRLMVEDKLYLDNMLSLTKLARQMNSKVHDLSQVLNQVIGKNFFDYINGFRVEEATELLKHNTNLSVFEIAMETGFNSKSTFYSAFKKYTGMTPYRYKSKEVKICA